MLNEISTQTKSISMNTFNILALSLFCLSEICLGAAETQKAFLDAQAIFDGWEANYGHINSMRFKAHQRLVASENTKFSYVNFNHWDKIVDGKCFYVRNTISEAGFDDEDTVTVMSFDGSIGKSYMKKTNTGNIYQGLLGYSAESGNPIKDFLNLEIIEIESEAAFAWWGESRDEIMEIFQNKFPEGIPRFAFEFFAGYKSGNVKVYPELDSISGQMCHVIEISPFSNVKIKYWLSHELNMLMMKYVKNYENGGYVKKEVAEFANIETDVGCFWYPSKGIYETKNGDEILKYELTIDEFIPYIKVPSKTFDIDFPTGTKIIDRISHISYVKGGNEDIIAPQLGREAGRRPSESNVMVENLQNEIGFEISKNLPIDSNSNEVNDTNALGIEANVDDKSGGRGIYVIIFIVVVIISTSILWSVYSRNRYNIMEDDI